MNPLIFIIALLLFTFGCTYSVNLVHTDGTASNVVDEDQKATSDIKPDLNSLHPIR